MQFQSYLLKHNVVFKHDNGQDLICIPDETQIYIIEHVHGKGHFGHKRSEKILNVKFHNCNMCNKIDNIIENCVTCLLYSRKDEKNDGELYPSPPKKNIPINLLYR